MPFFFYLFKMTLFITKKDTLSLHDALPIWPRTGSGSGPSIPRGHRRPPGRSRPGRARRRRRRLRRGRRRRREDRKSTRLNSSHVAISYAVFWLKKKKRDHKEQHTSTD